VRISELTSTANLDSFVSRYFNVLVSVISAFNTLDTGQPFSAASVGMGGRDQLFGIGTLLVLESDLGRVGVLANTPESVSLVANDRHAAPVK
jgi:hypothetical protein